jgi:macrolide-specific efflux system membrane fusion protein
MRAKPFPTILAASLLVVAALAGCSANAEIGNATPFPTPVRTTFVVQRGDIVIDAELFGRVSPLALESAHFQMNGHVGEVYVQVNDPVEEGQILADLVELQDLQAQATATRLKIRRAEIGLEEAQLLLAKLRAEGRPSYDVRIQELHVELAQMELDDALQQLGIEPSSDYLDKISAEVEKARLYAPVDGIVIEAVSPGRAVAPNTVAFTIGDPDRLEIVSDISSGQEGDDQLKQMYEGMPVAVSPNDNPTLSWTGTVRQLPSPYGTGSANDRAVHIVLTDAPDGEAFRPGTTVTVQVQLANEIGILWLPPQAIRQVGGRTFVIVDSESGPRRIDVVLGLVTTDKAEVLSGLDEGQIVIGP